MYFGMFHSYEDVCSEFQISSIDGVVLFAAYEYEDYSGDAVVIFMKDGKLFHVDAGHCSCFGLEQQWSPEEMPVEALRHIVMKGSGVLHEFRDGLVRLLETVETFDFENSKPETFEVAVKLAFS
jgi:hypothetical protein